MLGDAHVELQVSFSTACAATCATRDTPTNEVESVLCLDPTRLDQVPSQLAGGARFRRPARGRKPCRG